MHWVITDRFTLRGNAGNVYDAIELTEQVPAATFGRPYATEPGLKEYKLTDGRRLNKMDETTFQIAATAEMLTRNGPQSAD